MGKLLTYDPRAAEYIIRTELEELARRIRERLEVTGTNASGKTSRSLRVVTSDTEGVLFGRKFFQGVETGRAGGRVPRKFREIILQWMNDKGVHADDGNDGRMAYLIARKIARMGTSLYRRGGRNDIYSQEIPRTTESINKRFSELITTTIHNIHLNATGDIK